MKPFTEWTRPLRAEVFLHNKQQRAGLIVTATAVAAAFMHDTWRGHGRLIFEGEEYHMSRRNS